MSDASAISDLLLKGLAYRLTLFKYGLIKTRSASEVILGSLKELRTSDDPDAAVWEEIKAHIVKEWKIADDDAKVWKAIETRVKKR
jgi:hypothetical protein